jgi:sarcosine oxidase subunit beta
LVSGLEKRSCDVLVIGGGIAGTACAYYLAGDGADVMLVEARDLNTQASGTNAGSIHLQIQHPEFVSLGESWALAYAPTLRLLKQSLELWQGLSGELGEPLDVKLTGGLVVATTDEQMRQIARKAAIEATMGVETVVLGREELRQVAPYLTDKAIGAGFCAMEGKANPLRATFAFARRATERGANILTQTRVEAISRTNEGYRVETSAGPIDARRVVNAAGASAAHLSQMLGIHIGLRGFPLQVTVTEPVAPLIPHLVYSAAGKLSLKQAANGTCLIGGGWPSRDNGDGRLSVIPDSLTGNMQRAADVVPAIAPARAVRTWTATVNGTDDWRPLIGEVPGHAGFFLALFPWVGFSAGPMTARLVADLVLGRPPRLSLEGISAL